MEIDMKNNAIPVYKDNIHLTPAHLQESAMSYIKKLLPKVKATKKGSTKPRFVVDYVNLNKEVIRPHWPFTSSEHTRKILPPKAGYFISLDLKHGYFQCELPPASRDLT